MEVEDLAVHHDLPRIDWQFRVVERPVELLVRDWLVRGVVIRCNVLVRERLGGIDTFTWVEDEHLLEEVECYKSSSVSKLAMAKMGQRRRKESETYPTRRYTSASR